MADFDVFDVLPEVPVVEQWEFFTDVLTAYDGSQQRLSLIDNPRVALDVKYKVLSFDQRRSLMHTLAQGILTAYAVPFFQYAAPLTADAASGQPRVFFNNALSNIRAGQQAVLYNVRTGATEIFTVDTVETDGATFATNLANSQESGLVVCVPAPTCVIPNGQKINSGQNASDASFKIDPLENWALQRPNASVSLTTFDSLNVLDKSILNKTGESWEYRKEILDGGVGKIAVTSRDSYSRVSRKVLFEASRADGDIDFWREFFATVRGGAKSFLLSTQLPDLTLSSAASTSDTLLNINEGASYGGFLYSNDAFKRVSIDYSDGTVTSRHNVTSVGSTTITISPGVSSGAVSKISFLQRVRARDQIKLSHFQDTTMIDFDVLTVDD